MTSILGGAVTLVIGLAFLVVGITQYDLGDFRRMGPGMYPVLLSLVTIGIGALLLVQGGLEWLRTRQWDLRGEVDYRALLCVTGSVVVFGLLLDKAGVLIATLATAGVAAAASRSTGLMTLLGIAAVSSAIIVVLNYAVLRMPAPILPGIF